MNVTLAKTAGFCFGVQRAVDTVYEIIHRELQKPESQRKQIYTYGPIVHNETVIDKISSFGVKILNVEEDLNALTDGIVIIRAHGVPKSVYEILKDRNIETIDASCPFVQKIQKLAHKHTSEKEKVFIVGNPDHPEIIGIMGWAEGGIYAVPDIESDATYAVWYSKEGLFSLRGRRSRAAFFAIDILLVILLNYHHIRMQ